MATFNPSLYSKPIKYLENRGSNRKRQFVSNDQQVVKYNSVINDVIDLTDDYKCFICKRVKSAKFYVLTETVTNISKTAISQKLGEIMGAKYIIVVSDDDYICQNCVDLFNQLDDLENQVNSIKTVIRKCITTTYLDKKRKISKLQNCMYKKMQAVINKNQKDNSIQPFKKKMCTEKHNVINSILINDCSLQEHKYKKTYTSFKNSIKTWYTTHHYDHSFTNINRCTTGIKTEKINDLQGNATSNFCQLNKHIKIHDQIVLDESNITMNSIHYDHRSSTAIVEQNFNF